MRRLTNARKLSVFKHLFEGSNDGDLRKIERLQRRVSGLDKRIKVLRQEIIDPHILDMEIDDLRVRIDELRIRITVLRRGIRNRNIRKLQRKRSYLKDKAIKQGLESLSEEADLQSLISLEITCARFDKAFRELISIVGSVYENLRNAVDDARTAGIHECGRAPTNQQLAIADWDDEMMNHPKQQQRRQRRLVLDDSDDEEKTEGAVLSGVYGQGQD